VCNFLIQNQYSNVCFIIKMCVCVNRYDGLIESLLLGLDWFRGAEKCPPRLTFRFQMGTARAHLADVDAIVEWLHGGGFEEAVDEYTVGCCRRELRLEGKFSWRSYNLHKWGTVTILRRLIAALAQVYILSVCVLCPTYTTISYWRELHGKTWRLGN
jgi:hypothetical protein